MLLGYPTGELALLALWIAGAGILVGILAGLFGIGGGAVIVPVLYEVFRVLGVPEDVRIQLCIGTSLAIIVPTTVRSYLGHKKKGAVIPEVVRIWALPAIVGVAIGSADGFGCARPGLQDCLPGFCRLHRRTYAVRRRALDARRQIARSRYPCNLRANYRSIFLFSRRERRCDIECSADALRSANASSRRHVRRGRSSDHDCRRDRLHAGGLATYGANAAAFDRLCIVGRFCIDGARIKLHDKLRGAAGALASASQAGNRVRFIPYRGCASICREFILSRQSGCSTHPQPVAANFPALQSVEERHAEQIVLQLTRLRHQSGY